MKLLLLTRTLEAGGTERQILALAKGLQAERWHVGIACSYATGALLPEAHASDIQVFDLKKRGRCDLIGFRSRLADLVRSFSPDFVYSFLPVQNVFAAMLPKNCRSHQLVWSIRSSGSAQPLASAEGAIGMLENCLAKRARLIISNSVAGLNDAKRWAHASQCAVIHNGFDLNRFRPNEHARRRVRAEFGFGDDERVVGMAARVHEHKNHETFLRAAALAAKTLPQMRFVCVGRLANRAVMRSLETLCDALGIKDRVIWAGPRNDMPDVYNAFDVCVSASSREGLPNAIGEAMCCGRICVATDVGDTALLMGGNGTIVPPNNPIALSSGILSALAHADSADGMRGRKHIEQHFSLQRLIDSTREALCSLC